MFNPENVDELLVIIDLIDDAIGAAPRRPEPSEFTLEGTSDPVGVLAEGSDQELDDCSGHAIRESRELSFRRRRDSQGPRFVGHSPR